METPDRSLRRARWLLGAFTIGLVVSGLTALPLEWELGVLAEWLGIGDGAGPESYEGLRRWIATVREGLRETHARYPFIAYGTDWLAFGHIVIAVFFVGAIRDPAGNLWVIHAGMIACAMVIPMAMVFGPIRGIPVYWRLIDCAFGVVGVVPLWMARGYAVRLRGGGWGGSGIDAGH
jgi:hypothetical protein